MKLYSLRRATFVALLVPALLAMVLVAVSAVVSSSRSIATLRDHEMEQEGAFLLMLSLHEATEGEQLGMIRSGESKRFKRLRAGGTGFRIWSDNVVMTAAGDLPTAGQQVPKPGFADIAAGGREWRRFVLRHPTLPVSVEIAEPLELRRTLATGMTTTLIGPMLLLILAVSLIASFKVSSALRPMEQLSREIDARDSEDLRPLTGHRMPREIAPLVVAVNQLMQRLQAVIEREREFSDNAAHELRTPLAALKTRAQIAERTLAGVPDQQAELGSLVAAIDRATGVIEQLLILSRLQGDHAVFCPVDLSKLAEATARDLAPSAIARQQMIEAAIVPGIMVPGNADALSMVLRNLIDNAIRYTPAGGHVFVELRRQGADHALLVIADDGPGMPPDARDRAFERFTRFSDEAQGSGLGLSIVDRIVRMHGGSIELQPGNPIGLTCMVSLPCLL